MGISYANAKQISLLVEEIDALNASVVTLNTVAAANPTISRLIFIANTIEYNIANGLTLSSSETASVLNAIFGAYQTILNAKLASLTASQVN
jgi:hypothetical protein